MWAAVPELKRTKKYRVMNKQQKTMAAARAALDEMGLHYGEANDNTLYFGFATGSDYRDAEGRDLIGVQVSVEEEGGYVRILSPRLYDLPANHRYIGVFMTTVAAIAYRWKLIRCGWDPMDGEVQMEIDLPIMDGELTASQVKRALMCLVQAVGENHGVLMRAMEEGEFKLDRPEEVMLRNLEMLRLRLLEQMEAEKKTQGEIGSPPVDDEDADLRKLAAILGE